MMSLGYSTGASYSAAGISYGMKGTGGAGGGAALSFMGGMARGIAGDQALLSQAKMYAATAKAAERASIEAPKKASWEETRLRMTKKTILSAQRFTAARAGVTMDGTPTDVAVMTEREIEIDAAQIYREGQLESKEYAEQAASLRQAEKTAKNSRPWNFLGSMF